MTSKYKSCISLQYKQYHKSQHQVGCGDSTSATTSHSLLCGSQLSVTLELSFYHLKKYNFHEANTWAMNLLHLEI